MSVLIYLTTIFLLISCSMQIDIESKFKGLSLKASGVNSYSNQVSGSISFLSASRDNTKIIYECSLNGAAFQTCTSPFSYTNLSEGEHIFKVQAQFSDNDISIKDSLTTTWVIDVTPPTASFTSTPEDPSKLALGVFNFSGSDGAGSGIASYECSLDSGAFTVCSSFVPFVGLTTGSHNLEMRALDKAGNASTSVSYTWLVDLVAPTINISSSPSLATISTSATFNYTVSDVGGSSVGLIECRLDSAAFSACDSTTTSFSSLSDGQHVFYMRATDGAGNISTLQYSWTVDLVDPQLNSFSIANGATAVGIPLTTTQLVSVAGSSSIKEMRFSEASDFLNAEWEPFSAAGSFMLSLTGGSKTIYAQVRSAAGRVSNILQTSVTLDIGVPPIITVTAPAAGGVYSPGNSVNIAWTCQPGSMSSPLATTPITTIKYTVDDSTSWHTIASNLVNNVSATDGNYTWTLPSLSPTNQPITTNSAFKISISCRSSSGVVSNGMSPIQNSVWKIFAGEPGNIAEGVHIDAADLGTLREQEQSLVSDSKGYIYYTKGHGISRIDPQSGLVSTWIGDLYSRTCDANNLKFIAPEVVGVTPNDEIFIFSFQCSTITKVNTITKSAIWTKQLPTLDIYSPTGGVQKKSRQYVNTGYFIYYSKTAFYMVDLNDSTSAPVLVFGTPGACGPVTAVGTEAALSPMPCNTTDIYQIALRPDLAKIWMRVNAITHELIRTPTGSYQINSLNKTAWGTRNFSNCTHSLGESNLLYCRNEEGTGNRMGILDLTTEVWKPSHTVTGQYKNMSTTLALGATHKDYILLFHTQTNELFKYIYNGATPVVSKIGGSPFFSYGNGVNKPSSEVVFNQISAFAYDRLNNNLYVRATRHLRKFTIDPVLAIVTSISTGFNAVAGNSSAHGGMSVSNDGLAAFSFAGGTPSAMWATYNLATFNDVAGTLSAGINLYNAVSTGATYPALNEIFNTSGTTHNIQSQRKISTFLSDNNLYFYGSSAADDSQDHWIFKSDRATSKIYAVAGAAGAAAYNPVDSGQAALGASLKRIYGMQPDVNDDLLIFDGDHLRKITLTTESGAPKIYDLADFTTYPNYPVGTEWVHAVHDNSTGWSYFAVANDTSKNQIAQIWAAHDSSGGFVRIPIDGLTLSTYKPAARTLNLEVTPVGLLLLDVDKQRILMTPLMP